MKIQLMQVKSEVAFALLEYILTWHLEEDGTFIKIEANETQNTDSLPALKGQKYAV